MNLEICCFYCDYWKSDVDNDNNDKNTWCYNIDKIDKNLFLGDSHSAYCPKKLQEFDINSILIVGSYLHAKFPDKITYQNIDINDDELEKIDKYFLSSIEFIYKEISESKNVLVHCGGGISRSPTIVIAYLMTTKNMGFDEAYDFVQSKRECIRPNSGFMQKLRNLENNPVPFHIKNKMK